MSRDQRQTRLLTFTNLYPNAVQPAHGLFVERRLLRLVAEQPIHAVVIAPVPRVLCAYDEYRGIPATECRDGVTIHHPRFLSIRGLGRFIAPFTMFMTSLGLARRILKFDGFDVIDAHYFYPDGVAAALLSLFLKRPLVVTARGTDVNLLPDYWFSRTLIRWTARLASRVITVSEALRSRLIAIGVDGSKIITLRNGVDTSQFVPRPQGEARARLGLPTRGLVLLSVGNLIESKGHHLVIEALRGLDGALLLIVGADPDGERAHLESLASSLGVSARVRFAGVIGQDELVDYYNAADVLVLASLREGMPNVVLEALSCGLPVAATDCGGVAEVLDRPEMGTLMSQRSVGGVVSAVRELLGRYPSRTDTRAAGLTLGWKSTIESQASLYRSIA